MAPPIESALQLGFRFEPRPREAVTYYIPRLIAGEPMHAAIRPFIHAADIYACEPGVLAASFRATPRTGDRFFFTTFKRQPGKSSRAVRAVAGHGSWHTQGHTTDVFDGAGVKIGQVKKFRYKKGGAFTDWLMDEFSSCSEASVVDDRQYVLCKIYVSPRAAPDSVARRESDAIVVAPPPPAEEPLGVGAPNKKRPTPLVAEPPCPKRIRAAAVTTPVVPPPSPLLVQESALRRHSPSQPAAPAGCSSVAARDPFCTEMEPPAAAAQEDDGGNFDFVKLLEDTIKAEQERDRFCTPPATAAAQDDDLDLDLDFAKSLESSLETMEQAVEEAPAEAHQDTAKGRRQMTYDPFAAAIGSGR